MSQRSDAVLRIWKKLNFSETIHDLGYREALFLAVGRLGEWDIAWKLDKEELTTVTAERDALQQRVSVLEAALKPFANASTHHPPSRYYDDDLLAWLNGSDGQIFITVGTLRRAAAALAAQKLDK